MLFRDYLEQRNESIRQFCDRANTLKLPVPQLNHSLVWRLSRGSGGVNPAALYRVLEATEGEVELRDVARAYEEARSA